MLFSQSLRLVMLIYFGDEKVVIDTQITRTMTTARTMADQAELVQLITMYWPPAMMSLRESCTT